MLLRDRDEGVVDGPKVDCHHEWWQPCDEGDKNQAHPGIAGGGSCFRVEEALQKMPDKVREVASLRLPNGSEASLLVEAEHLRIGHQKEPLDRVRHGCSALPLQFVAPDFVCPAVELTAQRRSPDWAGS